jgi:hypothetical protein
MLKFETWGGTRQTLPVLFGFDADPVEGGAVTPPAAEPSLINAPVEKTDADPAVVDDANVGDPDPAVADPADPGVQSDDVSETEPKEPEGAPEEYSFEFTEGTIIDDDAVAELSAIAKELNLPQAEAQKFAAVAEKMSQKWTEGLQNHIIETRTGWRDTVKADKEIGGDKMPENLALAKSAIEAFGTPELKAMLDDTGIGDNPEFIRFALRVGKANSEHDFVKSGKPAAEVSFYDHPTSKPRK